MTTKLRTFEFYESPTMPLPMREIAGCTDCFWGITGQHYPTRTWFIHTTAGRRDIFEIDFGAEGEFVDQPGAREWLADLHPVMA